jgi:hypothetical protein
MDREKDDIAIRVGGIERSRGELGRPSATSDRDGDGGDAAAITAELHVARNETSEPLGGAGPMGTAERVREQVLAFFQLRFGVETPGQTRQRRH